MSRYYNEQGREVSREEAMRLFSDEFNETRQIAYEKRGDVRVSTVLLDVTDKYEIIFSGEYREGLTLEPITANVKLTWHHRWWTRLWAFIRRRQLVTEIEIPAAAIGPAEIQPDGTWLVEIRPSLGKGLPDADVS